MKNIQQAWTELNAVPLYVERFTDEEYEVIPAGFNEDGDLVLHQDSGFCPFGNCPCHEDKELIGEVEGALAQWACDT
jgi:hypothetical protein